jgi:uncharacterized protein (DUF1800 family)
MVPRKSRLVLLAAGALLIISSIAVPMAAQSEDPDPNSPTPVLISMEDSVRALALPRSRYGRRMDLKTARTAYAPGSQIVLFVTNLDLMKNEGANAFRVYSVDNKGRTYRFPVVDLQPFEAKPWIYTLTVRLSDEIGYWEPPTPDGDLWIYVTWRGLASNSLKLGLGATGGLKDPDNVVLTPMSKYSAKPPSSLEAPTENLVGYLYAGDRVRLQEQAAFGYSPMLDLRIRRIGLRSWLASQLDEPYPSLNNPYPNQPLKPGNAPPDCNNNQTDVPDVPVTCFRDTYTQYQPQTWFFREAFYGDAQLRHRVAWSLGQIWVTSGVDIQQGRHMVEWHKVLSQHAFGNYRDMMEAMTLNPTMGDYLDMARSTRNNPNENYAREIMQLFTVGLFMLNPDGTLQLDGQGNPIPTYDQNGVNNLTKVFTGWSFCQVPASCANLTAGTVNFIDPMLLNGGVTTVGQNRHDLTAKTLLSYPGSTTTNIAACTNCTTLPNIATYANASMEQALDNMFYHPNVGPFVSKILIQHLVTSNPTPAYVGRVAAVFNDNGLGVRGDMKAVVRAIMLDPEARGDVKTDPNYGKLREPVQFAVGFLRTFGVRSADGLGQSDGFLTGRGEFTGMAQVPFLSPTVFNFFPPDYIVPGTAMPGPEFALMTTGTSIQRANFMNRFVFTNIPIAVSNPNSPMGTSLDFSDLQALVVADPSNNLLLDALNNRMLHGTMAPQMRNTIMTAVNSIAVSNPPTAAQTLSRVRQAVYLVATSSQYQVQR